MNVRRIAVVATVLGCLGVASAASAELTAYLRIKGGKQGEIKGGATQKGREGMMAIVAFDHALMTPIDASSGQVTGKRQHKPLEVTKAIDKASPLLRTAMVNNEALQEVTLQFFQASGSGAETNHFTIKLTNARIISIEHVMLDNRVPESSRLAATEQIRFSYETITWTWNDGGVTASDSARAIAN